LRRLFRRGYRGLHGFYVARVAEKLIEIADSSLDQDTTVKLQLYAITGIPEYWVADLRNNRLLVYSDPGGDSYRSVRELHPGETVAPSLLPDCRIPVDLLLP